MDRPAVAVAAVAARGREVLLIRRRYPPNAGKWSLPGGYLELGESLVEGVLREVREETGVNGVVKRFIAPVEYIEKEGDRVRYHFVILVYLVEIDGDTTPRASDDAEEAALVPIEEAVKMDLTKTAREVLELVFNPASSPHS